MAKPYPVTLNEPTADDRHPGNANLQSEGYCALDLIATLQPHLTASTSGIPEPSHVLRAHGLNLAQSDASIRFSFGRFTTNADIHQAANLVIDRLAATPRQPA